MSIPTVTMPWLGTHNAMPYAQVVEYIAMYHDLAQDALEGEDPQVYLYEGITGGFQVCAWTVTIRPSWQDEPVEEEVGWEDVYVTVRDAQRLVKANLATYMGACDSMDEAIAVMADNAIPRGPEYIMADGRWEKMWTYAQAAEYIHAYLTALPDNIVRLLPYATGYEIVTDIATDANGVAHGIAGVYVSVADAERLAAEEGAHLFTLE